MADLLPDAAFPAASFSPCMTWRYLLRRRWSAAPSVGFVLLNPSTADERHDDPTIRRCIAFAKRWQYGGLVLGNLFAFRSTDPASLKTCADPVGPENDDALRAVCAESAGGLVICGWGSHGGLSGRSAQVLQLMRSEWKAKPAALALTKSGQPGHPLYLRGDADPFPFEANR